MTNVYETDQMNSIRNMYDFRWDKLNKERTFHSGHSKKLASKKTLNLWKHSFKMSCLNFYIFIPFFIPFLIDFFIPSFIFFFYFFIGDLRSISNVISFSTLVADFLWKQFSLSECSINRNVAENRYSITGVIIVHVLWCHYISYKTKGNPISSVWASESVGKMPDFDSENLKTMDSNSDAGMHTSISK